MPSNEELAAAHAQIAEALETVWTLGEGVEAPLEVRLAHSLKRALAELATAERTLEGAAREAGAIRAAYLDFWGAHSSSNIAAVGRQPKMPTTPVLDAIPAPVHEDATQNRPIRLNYAPDVRNTGPSNTAPEGWTEESWHQDAAGDAGTSHSLPGRLYVVQCEWCPEAFAAYTKPKAMSMFQEHEAAMFGAGSVVDGSGVFQP